MSHKFKFQEKDTNICWFNKTRKNITKRILTEGRKVEFIYNGGKEEYFIKEGQQLLACVNDKEKEIYNNKHCVLEEMGDEFIVDGVSYTYNDFRKSFIPSNAITVYKYQGKTIEQDYTIYDVGSMSRNMLIVSLSRAKRLDQIYVYGKFKKYYEWDKYTGCMPVKALFNKYNNGRIYKVIVDKCKWYIGSTCKTNVEDRLKEELNDKDSPIYQFRYSSKIKITLITNHSCNSLRELEKEEKYWINKYVDKKGRENILNKKMVKKKIAPRDVVVKYNIHKVIVNCNKNKRLRAMVNGKNFEARYTTCSKWTAMKNLKAKIKKHIGYDPNTIYEITEKNQYVSELKSLTDIIKANPIYTELCNNVKDRLKANLRPIGYSMGNMKIVLDTEVNKYTMA